MRCSVFVPLSIKYIKLFHFQYELIECKSMLLLGKHKENSNVCLDHRNYKLNLNKVKPES